MVKKSTHQASSPAELASCSIFASRAGRPLRPRPTLAKECYNVLYNTLLDSPLAMPFTTLTEVEEREFYRLQRFYWREALRCEEAKAYL
jgi:hypothetical protein